MGLLALWIYAGGVPAAYEIARGRMGKLNAACEALCWPFDLGRHLAQIALRKS